jgi:lipopolysaccharide biosynthesis glycosyltransferase
MKYIYVLTSSQKDIYYEQLLLSLASFRMYNPYLDVTVLVDRRTKENLTGKRSEYEKYASEIKVIDVPGQFSQKEASRWIKTSIHNYVSDSFLFIDCDTIITDRLDADFDPSIKIGAVLDTHITMENHSLKKYFEDSDRRLGFTASFKEKNHYNGGLIYCKNDPGGKEFFDKWHELWLYSKSKGNSQDMPSLNQANYELNNIISELPGEWNCQISNNGLPFLYNAKILHHYATSLDYLDSPFLLASKTLLSSIKETGKISADILHKLQNPKSAFELNSKIISDKDVLGILDSPIFSALRRFRKRNKKLFEVFNSSVYRLGFLLKKGTQK